MADGHTVSVISPWLPLSPTLHICMSSTQSAFFARNYLYFGGFVWMFLGYNPRLDFENIRSFCNQILCLITNFTGLVRVDSYDLVYKVTRAKASDNLFLSRSKIIDYDPWVIVRSIGPLLGPSSSLYDIDSIWTYDCVTNKEVGPFPTCLKRQLVNILIPSVC